MAQIDLRNAKFDILDGYFKTGTVNESSPAPANGDLAVTVAGFTAAIAAGLPLKFVGSTATYTVVSTVGGSTPTSITFTPALSTAAGVPANGAVVTVGPHILRVVIGEGNLNFEPKRSMEYVHDQRRIAFVRSGDDAPMDVSFQFIWEFLASASGQPPTVEEALNQTGNASTWVTSGADPCEPYCVDLRITYTPPCTGVANEVIILPEYRWESLKHDLKAGTVDSSGKCKDLLPVISRGA